MEGEAIIKCVGAPYMKFSDVISGYNNSHLFGLILRALDGDWPGYAKERFKLKKYGFQIQCAK